MNHKGRILVEHDSSSYEVGWETYEEDGVIAVRYTLNNKETGRELFAYVPHVTEGLIQWVNDMVMRDIMDHMKELSNADTVTEGFPDVEPISARAKPENDAN